MPMQVRFLNTQRLQVRVVALPGNVISVFGRQGAVVAANGDYTASQITNVPAGSVTAITVQAAIDQIATGAGLAGAALTKTDDTNVTALLGGTPLTALLRATSITLGWTGTLAVSRGGIGTSTLTSHGVLIGAGTGTIVQLAEAGSGTVLTGVAASNPAFTATPLLGVVGATLGQISFAGNTSGSVTIQPQAAAGSYNFNLPITAGVSGLPLLSGGGGATAMTFGTLTVAAGGTGTGTWATNTIILGGATATGTFAQVASGSSGTVLVSQGAGITPIWASIPGSGFTSVVIQKFTVSGVYTPTSGMKYCIIECIGGGGGGAGAAGTAANAFCGGGGGAGGYSRSVKTAATIGASQTATIGAGGGGGAAGANNGGLGGDTSLGALVIAKGSAASATFASAAQIGLPGSGGVPGTGDITAAGAPGGGGFYNNLNTNVVLAAAGCGGSSQLGGGAASVLSNGNAASNYGGGGGGGYTQTAGNVSGGAGSSGIIIITEFIS